MLIYFYGTNQHIMYFQGFIIFLKNYNMFVYAFYKSDNIICAECTLIKARNEIFPSAHQNLFKSRVIQ